MSVRAKFTFFTLIFSSIFNVTVFSAEIVVDASTDGTGAANVCELRDAIAAANSDTVVDGCSAGSGHDRISFGFTGGIGLEAASPTITKSLEIAGPGSDQMMIDGNDPIRIFNSLFDSGSLIIRGLQSFGRDKTTALDKRTVEHHQDLKRSEIVTKIH